MSLSVETLPSPGAAWYTPPPPRRDPAEALSEGAPEKPSLDPARRRASGEEGGVEARSPSQRPSAPERPSPTPGGVQALQEDRMKKRLGLEPCETCAHRRYQDESGDGSVSFQSPTPIAPEAAASAVRAHEYEHVRNEQVYARQEGREVVSQSVRIFTAICPECGRVYVSGGETRTTTASSPPKAPATPPESPFELVA